MLALRRERSGDDLARSVIAAHGVDGDNRAGRAEAVRRPGRAEAVRRPGPPAVSGVAAAPVSLVSGDPGTGGALGIPGR